ncbi:hypothetical protein Lal_00017856 [Lupinus albus]|nr:hypothetical protein Lal_00017856 [Lupinus albus]
MTSALMKSPMLYVERVSRSTVMKRAKSDAGVPSLMQVVWSFGLASFEQKAQMTKSWLELRSRLNHDQQVMVHERWVTA